MLPITSNPYFNLLAPFDDLVRKASETSTELIARRGIDYLSAAEAAALTLYSMDSDFPVLNNKLRSSNRQDVKPFVRIIWLLLHAMSKCPMPSKRHVFRGLQADISALYTKGKVVIWNAFCSCTSSIDTLQSNYFVGKYGPRTIFSIELTTNRGRVISACSVLSNAEEVLLPPNSRFAVEAVFHSGDGLEIVHLKELMPLEPILLFPGSVGDVATVQSLADCQLNLKSVVEENSSLTEEKQALLKVRTILNGTLEDYHSQVEHLRQSVSEAETQHKEELSRLRGELATVLAEKDDFKTQLLDAQLALIKTEEMRMQVIAEKEEVLSRLACEQSTARALRVDFDRSRRLSEQLMTQKDAITIELANTHRELVYTTEQLKLAGELQERTVTERDGMISAWELEKRGLEITLKERRAQSYQLKKSLLAAEEKHASYVADLITEKVMVTASWEKKVSELELSLRNLQEEHERSLCDKEEVITALRSDNDNYLVKLAEIESQLISERRSRAESDTRTTEQVARQEVFLSLLTVENAALGSSVDDYRQKLAEQQQFYEAAARDHADTLAVKETEFAKLLSDIRLLNLERDENKTILSKVSLEKAVAEEQQADLLVQLKSVSEQNQVLKATLENGEEQSSVTKSQLLALTNELADVKESLSSHRQQLDDVTFKYSSLQQSHSCSSVEKDEALVRLEAYTRQMIHLASHAVDSAGLNQQTIRQRETEMLNLRREHAELVVANEGLLASLSTASNELREQQATYAQTANEHETAMAVLRAECAALTMKLEESNAHLQRIKDGASESDVVNSQLFREREECLVKLKEVEDMHLKSQARIVQLEQAASTFTESHVNAVATLDATISQLRVEQLTLMASNEVVEQSLAESLRAAEDHLLSHIESRKVVEITLAELQEEMKSLAARLVFAESSLAIATEKLLEAEKSQSESASKYEGEIRLLADERDALTTRLGAHDAESQALKAKLSAAEEKTILMETENRSLSDLITEKTRLAAEVDNIKCQLRCTVERLQQSTEGYENSLMASIDENRMLIDAISEQKCLSDAALSDYATFFAGKTEEVWLLNEKVADLVTTLEECHHELDRRTKTTMAKRVTFAMDDDIAMLHSELAQAREQLAIREEAYAQLSSEGEEALAQVTLFKEEMMNSLSACQIELDQSNEKAAALEVERERLQTQVTALQDELSLFDSEVSLSGSRQKDLEEQAALVRSLQTEKVSLELRLRECQDQLIIAKQCYEETEQEYLQLLSDKNAEITRLTVPKTEDEYLQLLAEKEEIITLLAAQRDQLQVQLNDVKAQLAATTQRLHMTKQLNLQVILENEETQERLRSQLSSVSNELADTSDQLTQLNGPFGETCAVPEVDMTKDEEIVQLRQQVAKLSASLEASHHELTIVSQEAVEFEKLFARLVQERDEALSRTSVVPVGADDDAIKNELSHVKVAYSELEAVKVRLESDCSAATMAHEDCKSKLAAALVRVGELEEREQQNLSINETLELRVESLTNEKTAAKTALDEYKKQFSQFKVQMSELQELLKGTVSERDDSLTKLNVLFKLASLTPSVQAANLQESGYCKKVMELYKKVWCGKEDAFSELLSLADTEDNHLAQAAVAFFTSSTCGYAFVATNVTKAAEYASRSLCFLNAQSASNNIHAEYFLGLFCIRGILCGIDKAAAVKHFTRAAEAGSIYAELELGLCCRYGHGTPMDKAKGFRLTRASAKHGFCVAMFHVAQLYHKGSGVQADHAKAFYWMKLSADKGCLYGLEQLSVYYADGVGVPVNPLEAGVCKESALKLKKKKFFV
jgi:TPR repeat protein